jgi:hypothetical protein
MLVIELLIIKPPATTTSFTARYIADSSNLATSYKHEFQSENTEIDGRG